MALRISNTRFVKVWEKKEGGYPSFTLGTSRKDKDGNYINCNWFNCKFVGQAKDFGEEVVKGDVIKIISGQLENVYNKEKKTSYFNLVVFEAEFEGDSKPKTKKITAPVDDFDDDDEFPF